MKTGNELLQLVIDQSHRMAQLADQEMKKKAEELMGIEINDDYQYTFEEKLILQGRKEAFREIMSFTKGLKGESIGD